MSAPATQVDPVRVDSLGSPNQPPPHQENRSSVLFAIAVQLQQRGLVANLSRIGATRDPGYEDCRRR